MEKQVRGFERIMQYVLYAAFALGGMIFGFFLGAWVSDWYERTYDEDRILYEEVVREHFSKR